MLGLFLLSTWSRPALAQGVDGIDVQRSLGDGGAWLFLREPVLGAPWTPAVTASWNVARDLAVMRGPRGTASLLPSVATGELAASFVLGPYARVGVTAPSHRGDDLQAAWGDVSIWASFPVSNQDGRGIEGTWTVQYDAPTGTQTLLAGPGSLQGTMAHGGPLGRDGVAGRWAAQLGLQLHREIELPGTAWQDSWHLGAGYRYPIGPAQIGAEVAGRMPARVLRPNDGDVPVEGALVVGARLHELVVLQGLVGTGLLRGIGAPSLRAAASLDVRPQRARDRDADGVTDVRDQCRRDPEDRDGHRDGDGCPDPDNDEDGLLDVDDACPDKPENANGIDDEDGCPEMAMWMELTVTVEGDVDTVDVRLGDESWQQPVGEPVAHVVRDLPMLPLTVWAAGHQASSTLFDGLGRDRVSVALHVALAPREVVVEEGRLTLPAPVFFAVDAAQVEDEAGLAPVLAWLEAHPSARLRVEGRADASGGAAYNQALSERRAAWVVAWLVERGIEAQRLDAVGLGEEEALGSDADRRVGFVVAK